MVTFRNIRTIHHRAPWGNEQCNLRREDRLVALSELTWIYRLKMESRILVRLPGRAKYTHTAEKQPKGPAADLAFNGV